MEKAESTRAAIVDQALHDASYDGLEALSIGSLADEMRMSKSGVFGRFGSRINLQLAVLQKYRCEFEKQVLQPATRAGAGLPCLRMLFSCSVEHISSYQFAGCFYISCAAEYDDRPGPIRQELTRGVLAWRHAVDLSTRQAIDLGQLREETEPEQLVFEIYALLLALQHDVRLLEKTDSISRAKTAFDKLLERHRYADVMPLK